MKAALRLLFVLLVLSLASGSARASSEDPTTARGFSPEGLYQFGNLDNVNLFNGNLIIALPIGQAYAVTSTFGYQLMLSYNSSVWDITRRIYGTPGFCTEQLGEYSIPNRRSNAGMAWSLGYGRLFPACHMSNEVQDVKHITYESPDGAAHTFIDLAADGTQYTGDGSHLRLRNGSGPGPAYLDFPDGTTYTFGPSGCEEWPLLSMSDPFGNTVNVTWDLLGFTQTLADPYGRKTVIHYANALDNDIYTRVVASVDMPVFRTGNDTDDTARTSYSFHYSYNKLDVPNVGAVTCAQYTFIVPMLDRITRADGSTFEIEYGGFGPVSDGSGWLISTMTLPTKGKIHWEYAPWEFPAPTCTFGPSFSTGVKVRQFIDPSSSQQAEPWTYGSFLDSPGPFDSDSGYCPPLSAFPLVFGQWPKEQKRTVVTSPRGDKTVHFFSVWLGRSQGDNTGPIGISPTGYDIADYGLSMTKLVPPVDGKFLSSREYDCGGTGNCDDAHPDRSIYVSYEQHRPPDPIWSLDPFDVTTKASRTVYEKDITPNGPAYVDVASANYDGYGHYRQVVTTGNFGSSGLQTRSLFTNYNATDPDVGPADAAHPDIKPGSGTWENGTFVRYPASEPWILGTFSSVTREENGVATKQLFLYSRANGFLKRTRVRMGVPDSSGRYIDSGNGTHDLLTVFEPTTATFGTLPGSSATIMMQPVGEVAFQTHYGGDKNLLPDSPSSLADFGLANATGTRVEKTYLFGSLATIKTTGSAFPSTNVKPDRNTGFVRTSTDEAGHVTSYEFNSMGRLSKRTQPSGIVDLYTYPLAAATTGAMATATAYAPTDLNTPLLQSLFTFDAFGRTVKREQLLADGTRSQMLTTWNVLGQKVSEVDPNGATTSYKYDAYGRVIEVIPPDGEAHAATYRYDGARATTTTIGKTLPSGVTGGVGTAFDASNNVIETPVSTTEERDAFGRLTRVTESASPAASTVASYVYDVGDRMSGVTITAPEGTQPRSFVYDHRGFLRSSSDPETDGTTYSEYDAFGHAGRTLQGSPGGPFDLTFVYDVDQRLTDIYNGTTLVKKVTFDALPANDPVAGFAPPEPGRIMKMYRRNYHPELGGDVPVNTYFEYDSLGRLSRKMTQVGAKSFAQTLHYNELSDVAAIDYPSCDGCAPGATIPDRNVSFRWSHGYLTGVDQGQTHFTSANPEKPIAYWPNGMLKTLTHTAADGTHEVEDSISLDSSLARPGTIKFSGYCVGPELAAPTPPNVPVVSGGFADFSIAQPSGVAVPRYQWYKGPRGDATNPIADATTRNLHVTNITQTSSYWVRVAGDDGCTSDSVAVTATLRVCDAAALSITSQPQSYTIPVGTSTTLSVVASDPTATYQWFKGVSGSTANQVGTGSQYETGNLTAAASYWVRVKTGDGLCTVDSNTAVISVCSKPSIVVQPQSASAEPPTGSNTVTLSATVVASGQNLTYTWYVGAVDGPWAGDGPTLRKDYHANDPVDQPITYVCKVEDNTTFPVSCRDKAVTTPITFRLTHCITVAPVGDYAELTPARPGYTINSYADGAGGPTFIYKWFRGLNGQKEQLTWGGATMGVSQNTLTNGDYDAFWCEVTVPDTAPNAGCRGVTRTTPKSYVFRWGTCPLPPVTITPAHFIAPTSSGIMPTFTAFVDWPRVSYQWYRGQTGDTSSPMTGETHATLTPVTSVGAAFWVRVTSDECPDVHEDSATAVFTVGSCEAVYVNTHPQSVDIAAGGTATLHVDASSAAPLTYAWFQQSMDNNSSDTIVPGATGPTLTVNPTVSTTYYAAITPATPGAVCSSFHSAPATVRVKSCPAITVTQQPQSLWLLTTDTVGTNLQVTANSSESITYRWYVGQTGDTRHPVDVATGSSNSLHVMPIANPDPITGEPRTQITSYWVRLKTPSSCTIDSDSAVVTSCVAPHWTHTMIGGYIHQGEWARMEAFADGTNLTYEWWKDAISGPPISRAKAFWINPSDSVTYFVKVTGMCGTLDSGPLVLSVCTPPGATVQEPLHTFVFPGKSATLHGTVYEANHVDVAYQWTDEANNGVGSGTGTGPTTLVTLVTPAITAEKRFTLHVTAGICTATSQEATVSLCSLPEVYAGGTTFNVAPHDTVVMHAGSNAQTGYTFQWYRGTVNDITHSTPVGQGSYELAIFAADTAGTETYWATVTNPDDGCVSHTTGYTVTVCLPKITTQPTGSMLQDQQHPVTLTVAANNAASYQWYEGTRGDIYASTPVANGIGPSISVAPVADKHYWVRIQGTCGFVDSDEVVVTVCQPPAIVQQSAGWSLISGQSTTLGVNATGTNLTYQWYTGSAGDTSAPIAGGTAASQWVAPQTTTNYWVRITGTCGVLPSNTMTVTVCSRPGIATQPQSTTIFSGATATLSVTATEIAGAPPLTYQWYRGVTGDDSAMISGATSSSYTTPALTADTSYWVRVACGICPSTDSDTATVSMCAYSSTLSPPLDQQISLGQLTRITGASAAAGNSYMWFRGASGDTSNPLTGWQSNNFIDVSPSVTTQYWYRLQNGTCVSSSMTTTVYVCLPAITTQPASIMINPGASTTLSVAATPAGLTYQWYIGASGTMTSPINGATGPTLTVSPTADTSYWVLVIGSCAGGDRPGARTIASDTATVTLCQVPTIVQQSAGWSLGSGQSTTLGVNATGTNLTYQWYVGAAGNTSAPIAGGTAASQWVAPQNTTNYWVRITGTCGVRDSNTMTVTVCTAPAISSQPQSVSIFSGGTTTLSVTATDIAGAPALSYQWYRGVSGDTSVAVGTNAPTFTTPALTADTSYWVRVSCSVCPSTDSATATVSMCTFGQTLSAPPDVQTTYGQSTRLTGWGASGTNSYMWFRGASGDTSNPLTGWQSNNFLDVAPTVTTQYWYRVQNGTCVSSSLTVTVYVCIPTITTHPASIMINSGQSTTLSVVANTSGLTYQWYVGTSGTTTSPISGATGASVTVTPSATTNYWVRVTSSCARTVDSNTATVTICQPPAVTGTTPNLWIARGSSWTLIVSATGTNLTYQWYTGTSGTTTSPIAGATGTTTTVSPQNTTNYWVKVTGSCGSANSTTITISVCSPPTITVQPQSVSIFSGSSTTLSVTATEATTSPIAYQWYRGATGDFSAPVGTNASTYTTPALTAQTNYWVRTSCGTCNPTDSDTATVSMCLYPQTLAAPADAQIAVGAYAHLTGVAVSAGNGYQFFRGATGDTSNPLTPGYQGSNAVDVNPTVTTQYWYRLQNGPCVSSSGTATVFVCVPTITTQPQSVTIPSGSTTLTVAANTAGVTYQWYIGASGTTTSPISGATGTSFTVSPASTTSYWARATSTCARTADSNTATVTVCTAPAITRQPNNGVNQYPNQQAYTDVIATGTNLTYQWYVGESGDMSQPIDGRMTATGGTSASLQIYISSSLRVWVRITGMCGAVNSTAAWLSVTPSISTQPQSTSTSYGSTAMITIVAGGNPLHYAWYYYPNQTPVPGATDSPNLILNNVTANVSVFCVLTSGVAQRWSNSADITLCDSSAYIVNSQTSSSGSCRWVTITSNDSYGTNYYWYQGVRGDTTHPLTQFNGNSQLYVCPTTSTTYWCRLVNENYSPSCYTDSQSWTFP